MKKTMISMIAGLLLTLMGMLVNYLSFKDRNWLKLAINRFGGEITIQYGFGLRMVHIYAMEQGGHDSIRLSFDPFSFVVCFIVLSLIVFLVLCIIGRKKAV